MAERPPAATERVWFRSDPRCVRRDVPDLVPLEGAAVHEPWKARGIELGYPSPIVDAAASRRRAMDVFRSLAAGNAPASPSIEGYGGRQ